MNTRDCIHRLIGKLENSSGNSSLYALKDLGLLTERHTQNRYDEDYSILFDEDELINIKLADEDVNILVYYFLYRLTNKFPFAVTTAWCLGKCYGYPIEKGIIELLKIYAEDDDVQQQLLFSLSSITDVRKNYKEDLLMIKTILIGVNKPKVNAYMLDRFPELNIS